MTSDWATIVYNKLEEFEWYEHSDLWHEKV